MYSPRYTLTQTIIQNLARIEIVRQSFESVPISPVLLASLRKTAKMTATHYSTQIEGNRLTRDEVDAVLSGKKLSAKKRDESEVKAYYKALTYMEQCLSRNEIFSEKFIGKIHALVEGETKIIPYRDGQSAIYDSATGERIYMPPEAGDVPALMAELIEWVENNKNLPAPILAGIVHYQFVTIHPYYDGNGRTARLLTTFIMRKFSYDLKGIYSLEEYYAKNLIAYYSVLQTHPHHNYYFGRNNADVAGWLEYFIAGVKEAFEKVSGSALKIKSSGDHAPLMRKLNIRQRKILELFTEYEEVNSAQIAEILEVSPAAARPIIRAFIAGNFLTPANPAKKNRTYVIAAKYNNLI